MKYEIKGKIVEVAKMMYAKNMVNAYEGNISVKEGNEVYITPTSICKRNLTEDMIVVTDIDGNPIEGTKEPSSEIKLHLAIYKLRPDIKSVVHNHSVFATAHAIANIPIETKAYPEMIVCFDKVPVVEYGTPSTDEIHRGIDKHIFETDVFLLANHGVVALGNDVFEAFYKIEAVESIAKILTIAKFLGGEKPISDEKMDKLYELRMKKFGKGKVK